MLARDCRHEEHADRVQHRNPSAVWRLPCRRLRQRQRGGEAMNDATTSTASVDAAIAYLASKGALHKLSNPTPVLYKDIVMWRKVGKP